VNVGVTTTAVAWLSFWASVVAAWLTNHFAWMLQVWFLWLILTAALSVASGVWVLRLTHFRRAAVALVVLGLLIGQWWLLKLLLLVVFFKIRGFAP
jgi:hypothetical protein